MICEKCGKQFYGSDSIKECLHHSMKLITVSVKISKIDELIQKLENTYGDTDEDEIKIRDAIEMLENLKKGEK